MFGLLFLLICIGIYFVKEYMDNTRCKEKYRHPDGMTYTDSRGKTRLVSNDRLVFYVHDKNGDYVLEDETGHIYKNFSDEERQYKKKENLENAIENMSSTYYEDEDNHNKDWTCKGRRYIDFKTRDVYVIRHIQGKYYYMDITTGMLIRKTDKQIERDTKYSPEQVVKMKELDIDDFNEKQKRITDKSMLYRNFDYNTMCDLYQ